MYRLQEVPGKGLGLVATIKIPRGTRILSEEPIVTVPMDPSNLEHVNSTIVSQVKRLSPEQRHAFLAMRSIHPYKDDAERYFGIVCTVALPIEEDGIGAGVFLEASRINHACDNNAQKSWNRNIKRHTVHDIEAGEEITIFYLGQVRKRSVRQEKLRAGFGFTCACRLCSLPPKESEESDRRLEEALWIDRTIHAGVMDMSIISAPLRMLRRVERLIQVYNEQGEHDNWLPRAYFDAAQIAVANGDLARASVFVKKAVDGWTVMGGEDCPQVVEHRPLLSDLSGLQVHGWSTKWRTRVEDVPSNLSPEAFEDWLWRRTVSGAQKQFAHLRDGAVFPSFDQLLHDTDVDPDYYELVDWDTLQRRTRRHWCFLAEIVEVGAFLRVRMAIKDADGKTVPLAFHTETRGMELGLGQARVGYTVGILYAHFHAFAFDEPGIRQEDPATIQVRDVSS